MSNRKKVKVEVLDCDKCDIQKIENDLQRASLFSLKHDNMTFNCLFETYEIVGVRKANGLYTITLLEGAKPPCGDALLTLD